MQDGEAGGEHCKGGEEGHGVQGEGGGVQDNGYGVGFDLWNIEGEGFVATKDFWMMCECMEYPNFPI